MLDKKKLIAKLEERAEHLENRVERNYGGGLEAGMVWRSKELAYWLGAIQRGEFDVKVWED